MAAGIVAGAMKLGATADPMAVLANLPVATVPISVGLVIVLGLLTGLPRWGVVALASAYAVSPLTRELHAVGRIDHHFVEHFFFLASLCAGKAWLKAPTPARAVLFGAVDPGFVLARFGDGHYLRFHTNCAVIANNMIMTRQHLERIALTETLFDLTPAVRRTTYPWIDYVYLWR